MIQILDKVACGNLADIPSKLPKLSSEIYTLIEVAVPVLLVIMGTIDLFKGITADKEDEMVKTRKVFVKRLITGALVFFIMAITKFLVSVADSSNSTKIMDCVKCFIDNKCSENITYDTPTSTETKTDTETKVDTRTQEELKNEIDKQKGAINNNSNTTNETTKVVDNSEVINIGDFGVASTSSNSSLLDKETGSFTKNYSNINYYLYVPINSTKGMPLVIFLHGVTEKGNISAVKNLKPVTIITDGTLSGLEKFIFLAPASPSNRHWGDPTTWDNLINLIDYITSEYSIDVNRIYLTGFSAGGCGVWQLVNKYPNKFGAAVAVSCTPSGIKYENFRNTPLYAISGGAENYKNGMSNVVNEINKAGGNAQFKTIPNANHIATQSSYSTRELYSWLLSQ